MDSLPLQIKDSIPGYLIKGVEAVEVFVDSEDENLIKEAAGKVAEALGGGADFISLFDSHAPGTPEKEKNLIESFKRNLELLIHKTWVEKSDEGSKENLLENLEKLTETVSFGRYIESINSFVSVVSDTVYLLFGQNPEGEDFTEYSFRIDPDFGFFCWYVRSVAPSICNRGEDTARVAVLLGMFFLANF